MRNITIKVASKMILTKTFVPRPFAGRYPTRLLVIEPPLSAYLGDGAPRLRDLKNYKVLYFGKPNITAVRFLSKRLQNRTIVYEIDRAHIVTQAAQHGPHVLWNAGALYNFYHAYMQHSGRNLFSWLLQKSEPLRVQKYTVYNHFPAQSVGLKEAIELQITRHSGAAK